MNIISITTLGVLGGGAVWLVRRSSKAKPADNCDVSTIGDALSCLMRGYECPACVRKAGEAIAILAYRDDPDGATHASPGLSSLSATRQAMIAKAALGVGVTPPVVSYEDAMLGLAAAVDARATQEIMTIAVGVVKGWGA